MTHVQSAATRLVQLMERLRIGPNAADMCAIKAGAADAAGATGAAGAAGAPGGLQSSVYDSIVYNLHRALADAALARATLVFERNQCEEKLEQRTETWRNRMTERLNNQRSELEAGFQQTEKALRSELDETKKKLERLRGSCCIFLLDAEQLVELQGELQEAMVRVKHQQDRRACESSLCEKIPEAVCPITKKVMLNPVLAADGHTSTSSPAATPSSEKITMRWPVYRRATLVRDLCVKLMALCRFTRHCTNSCQPWN